jgi:hypothetical protein
VPRTFRELSGRGKVLALGVSAVVIAGLAVGTVVAARGTNGSSVPPSATPGNPSAPPPPAPSPPAPAQLPGATTWDNGVSSYVFGTNDTIDYGSASVNELPSVQADLKQAGLTLMRVWGYDDMTDATIEQRMNATQNAGMQCMFMLGSTNDFKWMEHVVTMLGPRCNIYEFGNEPDNGSTNPNGGQISTYTSYWISDVRALRALNPKAVFGGPTLTWSANTDGSQGSYPSDMAYFLAKTAEAGVRADFITYHDYPCEKATSKAECISMTPGDFKWNWDQVTGWESQYYGKVIPTGITEYNFDPGTGNLYNWAGDGQFMFQWTQTAIHEIVTLHMAFANQFSTLNYSAYGNLDMFHNTAPYGPKGQYFGMVTSVEKYGGPSTLAVPNPLPS